MERITVTLAPERERTRLLVMAGADELLRGLLGPPSEMHPTAAATLLEGLSLWYQRPLTVVLCVSDRSCGFELGLCDALGFGRRSLHYDVGVVAQETRPRPRRLGGPGDFRALRRLSVLEGMR
jgi:hypothetical protein